VKISEKAEFIEVIMGANSKIEWTTHTFNPWWGCTKVSEACKNCYAEAWSKRVGQKVWGPKAARRTMSDAHWKQPIKWNREAERDSNRPRVFCASMADVFEDRPELLEPRDRLFDLIEATPNLDWLLLTKRPQNIRELARWDHEWPDNVWLGTTVELQTRADELLPYLAKIPAKVRFISAEPLLGPLDIDDWLASTIDWVITGGESGPKARPASPAWFRELHRQCMENSVAFHFKQWGDWGPGDGTNLPAKKRQLAQDGTEMLRLGKKQAGRILDGAEWDQLPKRRIL
jgi:protein gp37